MRRVLLAVLLTFFILIFLLRGIYAEDYSPELSGDYEVGDKLYIDVFTEEDKENEEGTELEEIVDSYFYKKLWLRYKQKLNKSDYYYIKVQYYDKEYQEKINYNNTAVDLWTNYTFEINEGLDNKVSLNYRDKDYRKKNNTYQQIRLKYQVDYQINQKNDCSLYLQRQWKDYHVGNNKDNIYDRISLSWDWDVSSEFTLSSSLKLDKSRFKPISDSTDKSGRKFNIGFKWEL